MLTLVLQICVGLLMCALGAAAYMAGRRISQAPEPQGVAWTLLGISFLVLGGSALAQSIAAPWVFFAGAESAVYEIFLRWISPMLYSRLFIGVAMAGLLLALSWHGRPSTWSAMHFVGVLLSAALLGGVFGWQERAFEASRYFPNHTILTVIHLLLLLLALGVSLVSHRFDRLLWLCLVVYAAGQMFASVWTSALTWFGVSGIWSPAPWMLQACYVGTYGVMTAIAIRRFRLARRGAEVTSLLQPERRASLMGWE